MELFKSFDEAEHPRGKGGRFTKKLAADKGNADGGSNADRVNIHDLMNDFKNFEPIKIDATAFQDDNIKQHIKNVLKHCLKNLRGEYTNEQTDESIEVIKRTFEHILHHGMKKEAHIDSVLGIPQIIRKMLFVGSETNQDLSVNPDIEKYNYYVSCISINGKEYIVKSVIGISKGNTKYYDHAVISQSKSEFIETLSEISESRVSTNSLSQQDKRLFIILQAESLRKSLAKGIPIVFIKGTSDNSSISKSIDKSLFDEAEHPRGKGGRFTKKLAADSGNNGGSAHINTKFNEELEEYKNGNLPSNHVFKLGKPSEILVKVGFPANDDIELRANQLQIKLDIHNFTVDDIKDLPEMLQEPIAVFKYGDEKKAQNIIVELQKDGKNFLVGVHFNQINGNVSDIRGIFNKDNHEWLNWITKGKALYLNTKKLQNLINQQRTNLAEVEYLDLESIEDLLKKNSGVKDLFLTSEMNVEIRKSRFINRLNYEFCKLVEREKLREAYRGAYLDKLGRGYIAYLKKYYPELV